MIKFSRTTGVGDIKFRLLINQLQKPQRFHVLVAAQTNHAQGRITKITKSSQAFKHLKTLYKAKSAFTSIIILL